MTLLNATLWANALRFSASTGLALTFALNAVDFRTAAGAWDAGNGNATALLRAAQLMAGGLPPPRWQLGDEPDLWPRAFGLSVNGSQLAADALALGVRTHPPRTTGPPPPVALSPARKASTHHRGPVPPTAGDRRSFHSTTSRRACPALPFPPSPRRSPRPISQG